VTTVNSGELFQKHLQRFRLTFVQTIENTVTHCEGAIVDHRVEHLPLRLEVIVCEQRVVSHLGVGNVLEEPAVNPQ
jgi:hypothetical protein